MTNLSAADNMNPEVWHQVRILAAALKKISPGRGDRIALLRPGMVKFCRVHHAILAAGATVVPVSPLITVDDVMRLLVDSRAVVLLCHSDMVPVGAEAARMAGIRMFTVGPPSRAPGSDSRLEDLAAAVAVSGLLAAGPSKDKEASLFAAGNAPDGDIAVRWEHAASIG
ncbi:AMP-binding protein [Nonomuraea sp. NEAU-A123]|uniref:AMP-binding protein n=1 Tax=Nonomuraea sp. NEAU-A123 TaxID=2839649 RepID=UPI001BE4AE6F|nr:AMP-binding protein [Nonomuraea sp. NEAU-A123]MBT2227961.1 AMP-binding protein [Nonomuraea sp. NEAU-A123]